MPMSRLKRLPIFGVDTSKPTVSTWSLTRRFSDFSPSVWSKRVGCWSSPKSQSEGDPKKVLQMKIRKRKLYTAPPVAMERVRDTQLDLMIRLIAMLSVLGLAGIGLLTVIFWSFNA